MEYEIVGTPLPAVVCHLKKGEMMLSDSGAMAWMDPVSYTHLDVYKRQIYYFGSCSNCWRYDL